MTLVGLAAAADASAAGRAAAPGRTESVSMDVWKRPLREVAAELASISGSDILIPAAVENLEVSASLVGLDLRGALQRLLAQHSYMLIEHDAAQPGKHDRAVIEIVLFGAGAPRSVEESGAPIRVAARADRSVDELVHTALAATTAGERAMAVDAIAYRDAEGEGPPARAESVLLSALTDPAPRVRAQAIVTLKDTADQIPFDALSQVAREDQRVEIRIQALELLVERGEERALEPLRIALLDAEDSVRRRARELIEEWQLDAGGPAAP